MRVVTATATVDSEHRLTLQLPADIPPGARSVVVVLEEPREAMLTSTPLTFSPHPVGPADAACTYRREDMYGNDDR
jgi:hypothetical protein